MTVGDDAAPVPIAPRVAGPLPDLRERRSWALDALDSLREARGTRARERGDSRFGTAYTIVFAVVVSLAMGGSLVARTFSDVCRGTACVGGLGENALAWLGISLLPAVAGAIVIGARALGPAGLSAARRSWLGSSPSDRSIVVRDPLMTVILCGAVVGLAGGLAVALAAAHGRPVPAGLFGGATAGAAVGALIVLFTALVQGTRAAGAWIGAGWAALVVGVLGAAVAVGPWALPALPTLPGAWIAGAALLLVVAASVHGWSALRSRLRALSDAELSRGGDAAEATVSSVLMLETSAIDELRGARARAARGRFGSRRLRGHRELVLVSAEARRLLRARTPVIVGVLLLPIPVVVAPLLGGVAATVVVSLLGIVVGNGAAGGLRLWTRSSSVRRFFPTHELRLRMLYLVVPGLLLATWTAVACALTGLGPLAWGVLVLSGLAGVLRTAPQSSTGLAAGQMATTPMGAVPVGLLTVLMRGPDVAAIPVALLLLGVPDAGFMLALAILVWFCGRGDDGPRAQGG